MLNARKIGLLVLASSVVAIWFVFKESPKETSDFPTALSTWIEEGTMPLAVKTIDSQIEFVCAFGGYTNLRDSLAEVGIESGARLYNGENEFVVLLDYGENRVEYKQFDSRRTNLLPDFGKCVTASNNMHLTKKTNRRYGTVELSAVHGNAQK